MRTAVGRRQEIDSEVVNFEVCSLCEQQFYPLKGALVIDRLSNVSNSIPRNSDFFGHTYLGDLDFRKSTVKMLVRLLVSVLPRYMSSGKRDVVVKVSATVLLVGWCLVTIDMQLGLGIVLWLYLRPTAILLTSVLRWKWD